MPIGKTLRTAVLLLSTLALAGGARPIRAEAAERPRILVHYMPWFVARPAAPSWGWHWTMGTFDPETTVSGRPSIASHYHPLIGPYDSGDPAVIEYHLLLMKLAGIDGLVVDWYGRSDHFDYPVIHRNTTALAAAAARWNLSFAICYEDQTIPRLVEAGKLKNEGRVAQAQSDLAWVRTHWMTSPAYLKHAGRPVLLSFGFHGLTDQEWQSALGTKGADLLYLSEHRRRPGAGGAFDWPVPAEGLTHLDRFEADARGWPVALPAAYPRFHDIYSEARVHASHGRIADDDGRTFATTLRRALDRGMPFLQVVTWNDWGEGTAIEPSAEFGYRDLETLQRLRRERIDPGFAPSAADLRLPLALYRLRKTPGPPAGPGPSLDEVARLLATGRRAAARAVLERGNAPR